MMNAGSSAVVATNVEEILPCDKKSKECQFRRRTPGQSAALLLFLADMNWGEVMRQDLTLADSFDIFYSRLNDILNNFYPIKKVKITNHDPPFINADIKNFS